MKKTGGSVKRERSSHEDIMLTKRSTPPVKGSIKIQRFKETEVHLRLYEGETTFSFSAVLELSGNNRFSSEHQTMV